MQIFIDTFDQFQGKSSTTTGKKTGEFKDGQRYYTFDKGLYSVTSKDALERLGLTANIQT